MHYQLGRETLDDGNERAADSARSRRRARRFGFVACCAVLIAGFGGYAYGAIPNSATGVIFGCYVKSGTAQGTLRVIDAQNGATCKATETALSWNSKGINDRGAWSSTTSYGKGDAVLYQGQTYLARAANKAVVPTNTTSWQLLAAKGATGPARPAGPAGNGATSRDLVPNIGANDVPAAPPFVAPANENCLVTTTVVYLPLTADPAGSPMGNVRVAIGTNGGPFADDGHGINVVSNGLDTSVAPVTASWVFAVGAGQTIQFAAYFGPYGTNGQNGTLYVNLSYICS